MHSSIVARRTRAWIETRQARRTLRQLPSPAVRGRGLKLQIRRREHAVLRRRPPYAGVD